MAQFRCPRYGASLVRLNYREAYHERRKLRSVYFERDQPIKIIQDVIERRITTRRAAEHLGISDRQCRRLLARYREGGPLGMASRRCGMRGNRQLPPGLADQALELIKTRYADFGPTLAREKLEELHGLFLAKKLSGASWCGLAYGFP